MGEQRDPTALPTPPLLFTDTNARVPHPTLLGAMTHVYRGCSCKCDVFWGAWYP